jgi:CMP-N,N'-diacetyllegionaminic acid synthase
MSSEGKHIALIPARGGSKRLPGKNIKLLNGVPLIAYTIASAHKSNKFAEIIVSTDRQEIAEIAMQWGAQVPKLRPDEYATDESSDIEWVLHSIENMIRTPKKELGFISILRPTSPLRSSTSISLGIDLLAKNFWADSVRAMEPTNKHPGKMWSVSDKGRATPYLNQEANQVPTHNMPTQSLPTVWVQNASLEVVRFSSLIETKSISGKSVLAMQLPDFEGYDLNTQEDWDYLEFLVSKKPELLRVDLKQSDDSLN